MALFWRARSGCASSLRDHLERLVNEYPAEWRSSLYTVEVFESLGEAERRLTYFILMEGFTWVTGGGGSKRVPGKTFLYIYYRVKSANKRGLEDHVLKDREGKLLFKRQKEMTNVRQTGCEWTVRVSYKGVTRGSDVKAWILTVSELQTGAAAGGRG